MPASCPRARLRLRSAPHRTAAARSRRRRGGGGAWGRGRLRRRAASRVPSLRGRSRSLARSLSRSLARRLSRSLCPPPAPASPLSALLGNAVRSSYSLYSRAAIGCHRMCLSKQNYFSSSPSPKPRRRPSRTSVEDLGNFARLPCAPGSLCGARRKPRRRPGGKFACMQIF